MHSYHETFKAFNQTKPKKFPPNIKGLQCFQIAVHFHLLQRQHCESGGS